MGRRLSREIRGPTLLGSRGTTPGKSEEVHHLRERGDHISNLVPNCFVFVTIFIYAIIKSFVVHKCSVI